MELQDLSVGDTVTVVTKEHEAKGKKALVDFIYHDGKIHIKVPVDGKWYSYDVWPKDLKK